MTILSQRDARWKDIKLGNSATDTIGLYGCLITCFAMYTGKTPVEVNDLLKSNGGFINGDLFVWSKCTVLGLKSTFTSPEYASSPVTTLMLNKAKDYLDQGYPLVCEIDFNPSTSKEEMHYLLLVRHDGDDIFAYDPWTGTEINLDVYGGPARAIIQFRAYDKKIVLETLPTEDWFRGYFIEKGINLDNEGDARSKLGEVFDGAKKYVDAEKGRDRALRDLAEARGDFVKMEENFITSQKELKGLEDEVSDLRHQIVARDTQITSLEGRISSLEALVPATGTVLLSKEEYASLKAKAVSGISTSILWNELFSRLFRRSVN